MQFLDARELKCPMPVLKARQVLSKMISGEKLKIWCQDPAAPDDFKSFCQLVGHHLLHVKNHDVYIEILIQKK